MSMTNRTVLGAPIYLPVIDTQKRQTRVGALTIPHAASRRLPHLPESNFVITKTTLERLETIHRLTERQRFFFVEGEPGVAKTFTFRLYAQLAQLDFYRLNGFKEADETDLLGGDRPVPGTPGLIRSVKGFLPLVAEAPGFGLLDEISRFHPSILPGVLNPVHDTKTVKRKTGPGQVEAIPFSEGSMLAGTLNSRFHLGSDALPPDTANRFLVLRWGYLPELEEKQIAFVRDGLDEQTLNRIWNFHQAMEKATGPGSNLEYPIRPFSRRDFHRLCRFTNIFRDFHNGDLGRSAYAQALDLYFSRLPSPKDRTSLQQSIADLALGKEHRPDVWPPVDMKIEGGHLHIGDAREAIQEGAIYPLRELSETPFARNLMRIAMKARLAGEHLVVRGPSGLGKTAVLSHGLMRKGGSFVQQHFFRGFSGDDLMGRYYMNRTPGQAEFSNADITDAMAQGQPYLADEIDNARSNALNLLLTILDEGRLVLSQGTSGLETVMAKKGFQFIATVNPAGEYKGIHYTGKSPVLDTLLDRAWEFFADYMGSAMETPAEEEKREFGEILKDKMQSAPAAVSLTTRMIGFYQELAEQIEKQEVDNNQVQREMPTKRWLIEWANGAMIGLRKDPDHSLEEHLVTVAQDEILGRFVGEDRVKVTALLLKYFRVGKIATPLEATGTDGASWLPPWGKV